MKPDLANLRKNSSFLDKFSVSFIILWIEKNRIWIGGLVKGISIGQFIFFKIRSVSIEMTIHDFSKTSLKWSLFWKNQNLIKRNCLIY
ncbi:hypothetical protein BpHYR1_005572 [Brachionus plicatilis]|uniref:Uncharacterized protein n=1 Tax=Brachionus plicatilis TaxID=10195 RepID=A0A3M7R984_BRAPC|nr:hypothetical protein BpHYR1_005572 [Brachionus plicatilis]